MKIATWNLQRLEKRKDQQILDKLIDLNADILVLTETNSKIQLDGYTCISSLPLPPIYDNQKYKAGENRVSILTKYKTLSQLETYDPFTTVCTELDTPFGPLIVYGSIIGVFGNRQPRFDNDLYSQLQDFEKLFKDKQVCFTGDLNVTFSGQPWPSHKARQTLLDAFKLHKLTNTTANIEDTVDHIVLSTNLIKDRDMQFETWNLDKKLSDHVGHVLTFVH